MDWGNWTFVCDDMFDNGALRQDREAAQEMLLSLLASFKSEVWPRDKHPIIRAHDDIWERLVARAPQSVVRRYAQAMEKYCLAVVSVLGAGRANS